MHRLQFFNQNYPGRLGWHEIVVKSAPGLAVFDTDAFSTSLTGGLGEALQALPATGALDERAVHLQFRAGAAPVGAPLLSARPIASPAATVSMAAVSPAAVKSPAAGAIGTAWITRETRRIASSLSAPRLPPDVIALALLGALLLGAVHALSPGHGKSIVGAYLIGSRGTPRHAVFLGLTVTITHTMGVFVLGFLTLYASRYLVAERLFPVLNALSAILVFGMGLMLLTQRLRAPGFAAGPLVFTPLPHHDLRPQRGRLALASHLGGSYGSAHARGMHSHGGRVHSHLPPGARGEQVSWRSLLSLGISGGLVPCPSALVLLLAAVALNKTATGMLLVAAFSAGLAVTLTTVGLMFLYARHRLGSSAVARRWMPLLPVLSAALITALGAALCASALHGVFAVGQ